MPNDVVIVGAGRQGRNVAEILTLWGVATLRGYLDDTKTPGDMVDGYPVLGGFDMMQDREFVREHEWHVAIGNPVAAENIGRDLADHGAGFVDAIHPTSAIASSSSVGQGVYIGAFVRLMPGSRVSDFVLIEASSFIGVDVQMGQAARTGPGAQLLGGAAIGARSYAGANSVVCNDVRVGNDCRIGASAVVRYCVPDTSDAFGVPAKISPRRDTSVQRSSDLCR